MSVYDNMSFALKLAKVPQEEIAPPFYSVPFAPGGVATMLLRRTRGNEKDGWEESGKESRRDDTVGDTAWGNWKFLLPLRFHFTPNHATVAGFIQSALMRFVTETSLQIDTLNDAGQ